MARRSAGVTFEPHRCAMRRPRLWLPALLTLAVVISGRSISSQQAVFRSGVDLVNVTVTVVDRNGRFVTGLKKEDFTVFDDGESQEIINFSADRVPVSLGIVLDVSASMTPE